MTRGLWTTARGAYLDPDVFHGFRVARDAGLARTPPSTPASTAPTATARVVLSMPIKGAALTLRCGGVLVHEGPVEGRTLTVEAPRSHCTVDLKHPHYQPLLRSFVVRGVLERIVLKPSPKIRHDIARPDLRWAHVPKNRSTPSFLMTRTEVTVAEYRRCVMAKACTPPHTSGRGRCNWEAPQHGQHPINCVEWHQAVQFATWVGARLPTLKEWQAAASARGTRWPWGDEPPTCKRAIMDEPECILFLCTENRGCGKDHTSRVASRPEGRNPQGIYDLIGNVEEWLADVDGDYRLIAGGDWMTTLNWMAKPPRRFVPFGHRVTLGFRLAQSLPKSPHVRRVAPNTKARQ